MRYYIIFDNRYFVVVIGWPGAGRIYRQSQDDDGGRHRDGDVAACPDEWLVDRGDDFIFNHGFGENGDGCTDSTARREPRLMTHHTNRQYTKVFIPFSFLRTRDVALRIVVSLLSARFGNHLGSIPSGGMSGKQGFARVRLHHHSPAHAPYKGCRIKPRVGQRREMACSIKALFEANTKSVFARRATRRLPAISRRLRLGFLR